jgi:retron-type reverse transcriptase
MQHTSNKRKRYAINQSPFYRLGNRRKLANLLGMTVVDLRRLSKQRDFLYSEFDVKKKNGGSRGVENPRRDLKLLQARVARLLCRIEPPDYLFCPVKKRCYVSNAAQHLGQRVVHCLDIKRYYPSTPARRVFWFFNKVMQCTPDIAGLLTSLSTYKEHLPTGSPLSPILAFFAFYDLWEGISRQCSSHGYRLTVYVDDVTISGKEAIDLGFLWEIKKAIYGVGLRYHKEKHYAGMPAEITGVIVDGGRLVAPHRQLKKVHEIKVALRQPLDLKQAELLEEKLRGLTGQLAHIRTVQETA